MTPSVISAIVSDADVLIDYVLTNKRILYLASTKLFRIYVPMPVFQEVKQLSQREAKKLGLVLIEPTLDQSFEAMHAIPGISFQDKLCLGIAKQNNWSCLTNDKKLRRQCASEGIITVWGLELMLYLNKKGILTVKEAEKTARSIHEINSRITEKIVDHFMKELI